MDLKLRSKEECKFDEISLGEIMLRLDPGEGRIKTSRTFRAWEGGGEYNVARGLRRCFGMRTGVVTAFAENEWLSSIHQGRLQTDVGREEIQYLRESRQHHLPPLLRPHSC